MGQKAFMHKNSTVNMNNMEQMKNMYKNQMYASTANVNKMTQIESNVVEAEPTTFEISGQQEEIKQVGGENYVDRSV